MEVELGLTFPVKEKEFKGLVRKGNYCCSPDHLGCLNDKRRYDQGAEVVEQHCNSWPLVLWSGQPNEDGDDEDDDRDGKRKKNSCITNMHVADHDKGENDDHVIVGWPPIKAWRRKMLQQNQAGQIVANIRRHGHVHVPQDGARESERRR